MDVKHVENTPGIVKAHTNSNSSPNPKDNHWLSRAAKKQVVINHQGSWHAGWVGHIKVRELLKN
jgi:hypothetical protein